MKSDLESYKSVNYLYETNETYFLVWFRYFYLTDNKEELKKEQYETGNRYTLLHKNLQKKHTFFIK
jgi:hypothetical protein